MNELDKVLDRLNDDSGLMEPSENNPNNLDADTYHRVEELFLDHSWGPNINSHPEWLTQRTANFPIHPTLNDGPHPPWLTGCINGMKNDINSELRLKGLGEITLDQFVTVVTTARQNALTALSQELPEKPRSILGAEVSEFYDRLYNDAA